MRFQREARILARLRHPHIVTVYEVAEVDGDLYLAMDLAQGPSLTTAIAERGRIPWEEALALLEPVCDALDYAHQGGVAHRDLKPLNILLDAERGPLLADFGIARLVGGSSVSLTMDRVVGTLAYITPEVWNAVVPEAPADVYALDCIVYEMVTGNELFPSATVAQSVLAHSSGPQFPAQWPEGVPERLGGVLSKALAREPEDRFGSAGEMLETLRQAIKKAAEPGGLGQVVKGGPGNRGPARAKDKVEEEASLPPILSPRQPFEPEMILIPAGEFLMGSDPRKDGTAKNAEQPQHILSLPDYYISRTPVTNFQYLAFVRSTNHDSPVHWREGKPQIGQEDHPVVWVSWYDAMNCKVP